MREIKFRAWELDTAIIRYGSYVAEDGYVMCNGSPDYDSPVIRHKICEDGYYCDVAGDTVGQYTGLKDKNGVEIYEGDILRIKYNNEVIENNPVVYTRDQFEVATYSGGAYGVAYIKHEAEVIGNIYENRDLLC